MPTTDPLLALADELYALPPGDFTATRDARAKELRGDDRALADRVKALRKPSTAAWVLNLLVRREPEQVAQVLGVGEALREAQATLDGERLRTLTRQRRQVTAALATTARARAREAGHRVTPAVGEQLEASLTAALLDEHAAAALRSGLLVTALHATGVGQADVSGAVAVPAALGHLVTARPATEEETAGEDARPGLRVVPDPDADRKRRAAAEERLAAAEARLAEAREEAADADAGVSELQARSLQLVAEVEELRRRIAELEASAEEVDEELEEAEAVAEEAHDAVTAAESDVGEARRALEALASR
ncbi:hypothetical protein [Nocardioides solisilvae]|uniref:hypothetical protein n=1 Tax=Nocardioides solisilvae TaxID=1542435 RepID=UPI000D74FA38|nr:hypothetical protein [Nocardioides solisilvae]